MDVPSQSGPGSTARRRGQPATSLTRVLVAFPAGLACGSAIAAIAPWQGAVLAGWDVGAAVFIGWVWLTIGGLDAPATRHIALREDSSRTASEIMLLVACVASLVGVGLALVKGSSAKGTAEAVLVTIGVVSVVLAWGVVHTIFTLRYARLYYGGDAVGGIDFNEDDPPRYLEFAYLSFTIGMTYQVSDTNLTSKEVRSTALRQGLLSYVFGTVIVAMTINVVAGLLK
jgi:uncharacterized membrane protein